MQYSSQPTVSGVFSRAENFSNSGHRARGAGLASLGDALVDAGLVSAPSSRRMDLGIEAMTITEALASAAQPAGPLLLECQGQRDLALARACCSKLVRRMAADGREVSEDSQRDAVAAGVHTLAMWRKTGAGADGAAETLAARVAWRGVVTELSRDHYGDSVQIHTVSDDWLWFNAAQSDESREERAARFKVQRAASTRQNRLTRRLASMPGGRGKRAAVIERVGNAAAMLLAGETLDSAAAMAGFTGNEAGRKKPSDRLIQACKRLGLVGDGFQIRRRH
jgi:hypothetical protein